MYMVYMYIYKNIRKTMQVKNDIGKFRREFLKCIANLLGTVASLTANKLPDNTLICFQILIT